MTPTQPPGLRADEREALKPCPFCGGRPILTVRPDNANATAHFAAVACFCGGYASCAHKDAIAIEPADAETKAIAAWNTRAALTPQPATQPAEPSDAELDALIDAADAYVREVCIYDYGLPTHDEHREDLRHAMRATLAQHGAGKAGK